MILAPDFTHLPVAKSEVGLPVTLVAPRQTLNARSALRMTARSIAS